MQAGEIFSKLLLPITRPICKITIFKMRPFKARIKTRHITCGLTVMAEDMVAEAMVMAEATLAAASVEVMSEVMLLIVR